MSFRFMSFAALLIAGCFGAPANAATFFVASNGSDAAACSQVAPCATIHVAFAVAAVNDTIVCLSSITDVGVTIDKSIDIDCSGSRAVFRDLSPITINIPVSANDPLRTVRLRGISTNGTIGSSRQVQKGIDIVSANVVYLEDVVVSDALQQGILDRRTGAASKLFISDSIIRNNGGAGIVVAASAFSSAVLDNVRSENNSYGIAVASGNNVVINRSVFSGNASGVGVEGDAGAGVAVNNSTISHNGIGVQSSQSVRLSNNDIAFNNTAISGSLGSFGNNRFSGNGSMGTAPGAVGAASSDLGQQ